MSKSNDRINKMRTGEKIKCPKCESGLFSAVGDPQTTKVFRCDACQSSLIMTIPYKQEK